MGLGPFCSFFVLLAFDVYSAAIRQGAYDFFGRACLTLSIKRINSTSSAWSLAREIESPMPKIHGEAPYINCHRDFKIGRAPGVRAVFQTTLSLSLAPEIYSLFILIIFLSFAVILFLQKVFCRRPIQ